MKLLVIGKSGQLAQAMHARCMHHGVEIVMAGRADADITDAHAVRRLLAVQAPDVVINTAAFTAVDEAEDDKDRAFAINESGAAFVAAACTRQQCPLIHISTDYVFDGEKSTPYRETDLRAPVGIYGQSKLAGEDRVREICEHHLIIRTAWVYSPFGKNFVKTMLRLAETRGSVRVVNDQFGSPTSALHLADVLLHISRHLFESPRFASWGTYHAVGSGRASWYEVAVEVFRISKQLDGVSADVIAIPTMEYPTPAARPKNSQLDCSRLAEVFGVTIPDWREGIAACVTELQAANRSSSRKT